MRKKKYIYKIYCNDIIYNLYEISDILDQYVFIDSIIHEKIHSKDVSKIIKKLLVSFNDELRLYSNNTNFTDKMKSIKNNIYQELHEIFFFNDDTITKMIVDSLEQSIIKTINETTLFTLRSTDKIDKIHLHGTYLPDENDKYDKEQKTDECLICLNTHKSKKIIILPCKHNFHVHCIKKWALEDTRCALCRADLLFTHKELNPSFKFIDY